MEVNSDLVRGSEERNDVETNVDMLLSKLQKKMVVSLDHVCWEEVAVNLKWAVLVKLASGRPLQKEGMEETFGKVWQSSKPALFQRVERDSLLISFKVQEDQRRVLEGGPWTYEGSVLLMQRWKPGMNGEDFECFKFNIWVHIHNLPFELRSQSFAMELAKLAGDVKESNGQEKTACSGFAREYMRVRIELDTSKPILQGFFLRRSGRKPVWIYLKYAKLPNMCFNCGLFTHEIRTCRNHRSPQGKKFGRWLRTDERAVFKPE